MAWDFIQGKECRELHHDLPREAVEQDTTGLLAVLVRVMEDSDSLMSEPNLSQYEKWVRALP